MKATPARITAQYLTDAAIAVAVPTGGVDSVTPVPDWYVFWNKEPVSPDNIITIFNDGAFTEGKDIRGGQLITHPNVQIRSRHKDGEIAYAKLRLIQIALSAANLVNISVAGDTTLWILQNFTVKNDVRFLREEEKNRRQTYFLNGSLTLLEG